MKRAFSLVETMIAIAILVGGITAALSVLSFMLRTVHVLKHEFIAAHLASEGVEVIRNIRDTNWLRRDIGGESINWRNDLAAGNYEVVFNSMVPQPDGNQFLAFDAAGHYSYGAGASTSFKRRIELQWMDTPGTPLVERLRVRAVVTWQDPFQSRQVAVEELLYDWK